jgi:hypothetical protein
MGVFDPSYKRLWLIIVLFVFLTAMYTCQSVLLVNAEQVNEPTITILPSDNFYLDEQNQSGVRDVSKEQGVDLFSLIGFMTFTTEGLPTWIVTIFAPIVTTILIVQIYLIIDITYDIIKALPFT